jgi:hypothetical protein
MEPLPHSTPIAHAQFEGGSGEFAPSDFQRLHHENPKSGAFQSVTTI